jgi:hypothetical protein
MRKVSDKHNTIFEINIKNKIALKLFESIELEVRGNLNPFLKGLKA